MTGKSEGNVGTARFENAFLEITTIGEELRRKNW